MTGMGMAMLYPTLGAAVSDIASQSWRGTALGVYRFWRDLGYAIGGIALALTIRAGFDLAACCWVVSASVAASAFAVWTLSNKSGISRPQVT
jgi:MFS family permease